jgi:hypothetical protein
LVFHVAARADADASVARTIAARPKCDSNGVISHLVETFLCCKRNIPARAGMGASFGRSAKDDKTGAKNAKKWPVTLEKVAKSALIGFPTAGINAKERRHMSPRKNGFPQGFATRLAARARGAGCRPSRQRARVGRDDAGPVSGGRWGPSRATSRCTSTFPTPWRRTRRSWSSSTTAAATRQHLGEASSAAGTSYSIKSKVDAEGIIVLLPQLNGRNCWDVATTAALTHATGTTPGGDTKAIVDMVKYQISKRNANANRVYAIGSSSAP